MDKIFLRFAVKISLINLERGTTNARCSIVSVCAMTPPNFRGSRKTRLVVLYLLTSTFACCVEFSNTS